MNTKFLSYVLTFLLSITLTFAGDNSLTLNYYDEAGNPIPDAAVWLFECTDSSCGELTGTLPADIIDFDDSGTSNSVTLTLPKTSRETFYVAYAFAKDTDTYLPHAYYGFSFNGDNVDAEEDLTLEKKEGCQSTIQSFKVTNTKSVGTPATMSVDVASAFDYDDSVYPWGYDASADAMTWYQDWYSAETEVTLTIYREFTFSFLGMEKTFNVKVYATTETANILAGETEPIKFTWTPTKAGSYRATVMTDVVDAQCASSEKDAQSRTFTIEEKDEGTEETPDIDWGFDIEEQTFPSLDIDPSISSCSATPNPAVIDEEIAFETTPSLWTGLLDVIYTWNFGDGEIASGEDVTHTYAAAGIYTAIVTATDSDDGASDTCAITVEVTESVEEEPEPEENIAPTVSCSFDGTTAFVDEALLLEADALDSDGSLVDYAWDFGDGSTESTTETLTTHTYTSAGTYSATFTVTDDDDATASCSGVITISEESFEEPEPENSEEPEDIPAIAVASANPMSGEPTLWVGFSSAGSSGDLPLSYYWTFGTGEGSSTHANPGHYYDKEGRYTATLTVVDADGDSDTARVTITVIDELENIAGRHYYIGGIAMSNNGNIRAGETLEIYVRAENIADFDKDAVSYNAIIQELGLYATSGEFDLDAGAAEAMILSLDIPENTVPGIYNIRITISDDDVKRIVYRDVIVLS